MPSFTFTSDVMVPMRDGVRLAVDIWRPETDEPVPLLLGRMPYPKDMMMIYASPLAPDALRVTRSGYAIALAAHRGTNTSQGEFRPHVDEADDGVDLIEWLADQHWCNGRIGTFGGSYLGFTQWHPAPRNPKGLKGIAPTIGSADVYRTPWYSPGGALSLGSALDWGRAMSVFLMLGQDPVEVGADLTEKMALNDTPLRGTDHTPVADQKLIRKYLPTVVDDIIGRPHRDEWWDSIVEIDRVSQITTPSLSVGGWYDLFITETLRGYTEMRASAATEAAREGQRLIVGPWSHINLTGLFRDRAFGAAGNAANRDLTSAHLSFFDPILKDGADGPPGGDRVSLFVMGIDQWRTEADWPLPDTTWTHYYLDGDGSAATAGGAGRLVTDDPVTTTVDTYAYDPADPVPAIGGTQMLATEHDGALDQRAVHDRPDVLCFVTEVLEEPVEVVGPVSATLFVSSDRTDTDFTAKLVDVHPDGRAIILCDGIQRMRYRDSLREPKPMTPGEIYEIEIDMVATANVFRPGHRILVEISSSNFPRYDRNSNTGGTISAERLEDMVVATNTLHRGPEHPSRVTLPVIDR